MVKCQKTDKGYLNKRHRKLASQEMKDDFKLKLRRLKELHLRKKCQKPRAPHNTTQYLMDLHEITTFDSDELLDILNERRGTVGEVILNNPTFGNVLSSSMINSLHRTLMSMELDSDIRMILMKSSKDFCVGTDYLCNTYLDLAHSAQNPENVEKYFRELYAMIWDMSKMETPLVPLLTGRLNGSGAVLAGLSHFGIASLTANACFPETKFGFMPTGGSSYLLSRLPCELGLYLALTGLKLEGTDLRNLNLSHTTADITEFLPNFMMYEVNNLTPGLSTQIIHGNTWQSLMFGLNSYSMQENIRDSFEIINRTNLSKFYRNYPENMRMTVADVIYSRKVRQEASNAPGTQYTGFSGQPVQNFLENFERSVIEMIEHHPAKPLSIHHQLPSIYRCFSAKTLDEVFERLMSERTNGQKIWAEEVLSCLSQKSPIALEMTFHLMKRAADAEWSECLQNEFKAAVNLSKHPDFINGAKAVLSRIKSKAEWTSKFPISKDQVLELSHSDKALEIDSKPGQLLPVKEYFKEYPHNPRFWINEISPTSSLHRRDYDLEVQSFLNGMGFDIRDFNLEIPVVRSKIFLAERNKQKIQMEEIRMQRLSQDQQSLRIYFNHRLKAIHQFISASGFKEKLRRQLESHFRKAFEERVETIKKNSAEAHNIKKRGMWREMKDYIENQVLEKPFSSKQNVNHMLEFNRMKPVPMSFPKSLEGNYLPEVMNQNYEYKPDSLYTSHFFNTDQIEIYNEENLSRYTDSQILDDLTLKDSLSSFYAQIKLDQIKEDFNEIIDGNGDQIILDESFNSIKESIQKHLDADNPSQSWMYSLIDHPEKAKKNNDHSDSQVRSLVFRPNSEITELSEIDESSAAQFIPISIPKHYFHKDIEEKLFSDRETLANLVDDVYVKTGCKDLKEGIEKLRTKSFEYDPEAMKHRRRQIITEKYACEEKFSTHEEFSTLQRLFSKNLVNPSESEITNKMLKNLEYQNSKVLLSKLQQFRELERPNYDKNNSDTENEEYEVRAPKNTIDQLKVTPNIGTRLKFENDYLKLLFGQKTYIPLEYDITAEDAEEAQMIHRLCDFKETNEEWIEKTFKKCIELVFEARKIEEMQLTTAELLAYDQDISQTLTPAGIQKMMINYLHQELISLQVSRESELSEDRQETSIAMSSIKGNDGDLQEFMNKNPELRDTIEAYIFSKKMQAGSQPKKDSDKVQINYQGDPLIKLFFHEQKHGLLKTQGTDAKEIINSWKSKYIPSRSEIKDSKKSKRRSLIKLKQEMNNTVLVMKSVEQLLKKKKFQNMEDEKSKFEKLLQESKDIY